MTSLIRDVIFPPLPETARATPIVLGTNPNSEDFLYCNDRYVVVRNIKEPTQCRVYINHQARAHCARYSPNGNYVASGDAQGRVHIWAMNSDDVIKKYDHQLFNGAVRDIAWTHDNAKLVAVGGAGSSFAHFFRWDSSNKINNVSYSSKAINSVDLSPANPLRCCMASEDQRVHFLAGPKLDKYTEIRNHSSFVQCARFTPNGGVFMTGGSDSKLFVFNGEDGAFLRELTPQHKGGIYAIAPSADSRQVLTASGDKTASIYDIETGQVVQTYRMGTEMEDMQLGCMWVGEHLVTVSLSGYINYLDLHDTSRPYRIIQGHKRSYSSSFMKDNGIIMGSYDGRISKYDMSTGQASVIKGRKEVNVQSLVPQSEECVLAFAIDNSAKAFNPRDLTWRDWDYALPSQPCCSASDGQDVVVGCVTCLIYMVSQTVVATLDLSSPATYCDISKSAGNIVCSHSDTSVYDIPTNGKFLLRRTLPNTLRCLKYSPDGKMLAGVHMKEVVIFSVPSYEQVGRGYFGNYSSIQSVAWSPDCRRIMTASIDSSLIIWNVGTNRPLINLDRTHFGQPLMSSFFVSNERVASFGSDSCMMLWTIK